MKIAFFVNDVKKELPRFTTTALAREACRSGHEVWYVTVGDLVYDSDDSILAHARRLPPKKYRSPEGLIKDLQSAETERERVEIDDIDVLLLRNDPAQDAVDRPWAQDIGIIFGEIAARRGVVVLNDPAGLLRATNKLYFQQFPVEVRPRTLITRSADDVRHFVKAENGRAVLKPLQGSGGQNVFLVEKKSAPNLSQMIEAITRDGYIVCQEYLPEAEKGDVRLFVMNGRPLERDGKYAALLRATPKGEIRSNMHAGGKAKKVSVGETQLRLAELVRPKLVEDGMFLVGLDIVGDKLMEVNVFSPGGLHSISALTETNFSRSVIESLEYKVGYMLHYRRELPNRIVATL
ncbi:MAG TPA: glutathione synthetase [Gammaproteobacteria bacterium]|nr:glutathione synthetase [Gammaproteobacteria bacterium]